MKPFLACVGQLTGTPPMAWTARLSTIAAAALLAACSSTPLPPWPSSSPGTTASAPAPVPAPATPPADTIASQAVASTLLAPLPYSAAVAARFPDPATHYETPGLQAGRSNFTTQTEMAQWLRELANKSLGSNTLLGLVTAGMSQRGEPIQALVATRAPSIEPRALDAQGLPTVMLVGQQHGDEPAGSEALLLIAREFAPGGLLEPLLARINVVIVARANPDGALAGQRTTANGVDMAHDHLLLRTPEAQALAALTHGYHPMVVLDAGEFSVIEPYLQKFKALPRHDVLLQYAGTANVHEFITKAAREWLHAPMKAALQNAQLSSDWYYTPSADPQDLSLSMDSIAPDTLTNVNALRNALGLVVKTRGAGIGHTHLQRRVHSQVVAISSALHSAAERAAELSQVQSFVRRDIASHACRNQLVVQAAQTPQQREVTMLQPDTGADYAVKVHWNSSLTLRPLTSRIRPCGYWLATEATTAAERLEQLGLQVLRVAESAPLIADAYTALTPSEASASTRRVQVTPTRGAVDAAPGSFYVPMNQPGAHLVAAALEPDTAYSFFAHHVVGNLTDVARIMGKPSLVFEEEFGD